MRIPAGLAAAVPRKERPAYRAYLCLKGLDKVGVGQLRQRGLDGQLAADYRVGKSTARNWLRADPDNYYWHTEQHWDGKWLVLHSWARVQAHLGMPRVRGFSTVPITELQGGVVNRRSAQYEAHHQARRRLPPPPKVRPGLGAGASYLVNVATLLERANASMTPPTTRTTLQLQTGVSPNTQRKYERLRGIERIANYAEHWHPWRPWYKHHGDGFYEQLGNSYRPKQYSRCGQYRARQLNSGLCKAQGATSTTPWRAYYYTTKAYLRSKATERALFYGRTRRGTGIWQGLGAPGAV